MSPFDLVLFAPFLVITIALTLYFTLLTRIKPAPDIKLSTYLEEDSQKKPQKQSRKASKSKLEKPIEPKMKADTGERECPHYVGYLTTLPKGSPFPDECFGCRKVIQCLRLEPTRAIESFYLATPEAE